MCKVMNCSVLCGGGGRVIGEVDMGESMLLFLQDLGWGEAGDRRQ